MNITPQVPNLSIPTVLNPHTETLRRENNQREVIAQPAALAQSAAEKGVASDKERGRTPAQNNENIDFASLKEKAELANNVVSEQKRDQSHHQGDQQANQQHKQDQESDSSNSNAQQDANQGSEQSEEISNSLAVTGATTGESSLNREESQEENKAESHQGKHQEFQASRAAALEAQEVAQLQDRDQEVRAHELAHATVGGASTGAPSYSYQTGPDGKQYAVGGEVSVDLSPIPGDPTATIAKMQKVHAAALAPANPSTQDNRVAASAAQAILQAQSELLELSAPETSNNLASNPAQPNNSANPVNSDNSNNPSDSQVNIETTLAQHEQQAGNQSAEHQNNTEQDFDTLINQTLEAQEQVVPTRSDEVDQRAKRVESFYTGISQAYQKPASYQFELTA